MSPELAMAARGISKQYPGTLALDGVDFPVYGGRVNALIGENGAGKSTLMRILAGIEEPDSGVLEFSGQPRVAMIHQELNLLPNLTVAENIFLGRELTRHGMIDRRAQETRTRELMTRLEERIEPRALLGDLPLGQQQIVEIAKALAQDARVLIMDEPTSALSAAEIEVLFRIIRELKSHGVAVVYISHRLEELLTIGDRVTVLRDGRVVAECEAASVDVAWLVERMTGRAPAAAAPHAQTKREGEPALSVRFEGVAFDVRPGEIVGFYGLLGAGRTELFERIMALHGIGAGVALVPEDRQGAGIVPPLSVRENITLASMKGLYLSPEEERQRAAEMVRDLSIRTAGLEQAITSLSGGNQQKVVLARFLLTRPKVLLLDDPTRGVDVGARTEIYAIIRRLAGEGIAVVFSSSELKEVLELATRIMVMAQGRITAEFSAGEATEEALVAASAYR